jgi:hypothetical protein
MLVLDDLGIPPGGRLKLVAVRAQDRADAFVLLSVRND